MTSSTIKMPNGTYSYYTLATKSPPRKTNQNKCNQLLIASKLQVKLDQTTPQTVTNGRPIFDDGVGINQGAFGGVS